MLELENLTSLGPNDASNSLLMRDVARNSHVFRFGANQRRSLTACPSGKNGGFATGCDQGLQPRFWRSMGRTPSDNTYDISDMIRSYYLILFTDIYWYGESAKGLRFVASVHCHRSARATC